VTTSAARPGPVCRAVVWLATGVLPSEAARRRYRGELLAELYGCGRGERAATAAGFLVQAWALRAAVVGAEGEARPRRAFGCWTNLHHRWQLARTDDGDRFYRCTRCGRDDYLTGAGPDSQGVVTGSLLSGW
jgi:hypothetical protein